MVKKRGIQLDDFSVRFAMYRSSNSTTTTTNFANSGIKNTDSGQISNEFGPRSQLGTRLQQIGDYRDQKCSNNNEFTHTDQNNEPFPKFDELNAYINSEEFLDHHHNYKQEPIQEQQQFFVGKDIALEQSQAQQQQQQQHFQQVNLLRAPERLRENNNTTSENSAPRLTEPRHCSNIGLSNNLVQRTRDEQQTLLTPQVQLDDEEGKRLQYLNQYQQMKETIYQETKSFFYDNTYNPTTEETSNMANISNSNAQNQQQPKGTNYNSAPYRDIFEGMIKQEKPYVEIVEQPAKCSLRFRYKCEGRSAGSLPGVNSCAENKTYPSIQIRNYTGRAVVVISCVTKDAPYLAHPHNIVGKEGCKKGICTVVVNNDPSMIRSFSSLGIQCVKRKDIEESLSLRESIHVDPYRNGFSHKLSSSNIDLNVVRLCFQVFVEGSTPTKCDVPLTPVVSDPIHDKKAMSDLVITKLSHCTAPASGGREVILLCDRISRDDIQVRFFEERDGKLLWETYTELAPTDIHKQVAICFKSPKYYNESITQPVSANVQLKRPSDNQVSEPRVFKFLPCDSDEDMISRKRQKIHQFNENLQHHHHYFHQHQQQQHQQRQQQQHLHQTSTNLQAQNHHHNQPQLSLIHKQQGQQQQQQQVPRIMLLGQESNFQQLPGRSSASPNSRIASPVTPVQASSPQAPASLDRRMQQGLSPSPTSTVNHHNQSNQPMQNQNTYMIDQLQQQQNSNSVVRREIIANDGKVVRLVDRPSQHPLAQASSSNECRGTAAVHATTNQQQHRDNEDSNKAPLGLSLARIDSDQLMRADMAFNSNMNLDLGSSISIHLNGNGNGNGNNVPGNNHTALGPMP